MAERSTRSKRSSLSCSRPAGFTLAELLVAFAVTMAVTAGALMVTLSSRRLYAADVARTHLNQSLRASRDFLVADIRQAGERLATSFPVIEIVRGEDLPGGSPGDPDELIIRRNLLDTTLRSCRAVDGTERRIYLAELEATPPDTPPPGCVQVPDSNGDGWPDNHETWHDYRESHGVEIEGSKAVTAYLYNPTNGNGEFFSYWRDDKDAAYIEADSGSWNFSYPIDDGCQVFILEERRYRLTDDVLQIVVNQHAASPLNVVSDIEDFQVRARFQIPPPPAPQDEPPPAESFGFGDDWGRLRAIEVSVMSKVPIKDRFLERGWTSEIMPRNVLSR